LFNTDFRFTSLADLAELVVVSAFPCSCKSVLDFEGQMNSLWASQITEGLLPASGYRIVLLSKKRELANALLP
jgi:hypothetical protein